MHRYRSDTLRNRIALFDALESMLSAGPREITLTEVAAEAQVSPATAYRYFGSMDGLVVAYRERVSVEFREEREKLDDSGIELLRATCDLWLSTVWTRGGALSQVRSRVGYLKRLLAGSEDLVAQEAAVGPAIRSACEELGITYPGPVAIFAWSQIYDPRDILDLRENVAAEVELRQVLFESFLAALQRWSEGGANR
ncbi:MAG: TetR/AcrR family transcriptional regulator [Brevibacterium sp.]